MLRFTLGLTRKDGVEKRQGNECSGVGERGNETYGQRMLGMQPPGRRQRTTKAEVYGLNKRRYDRVRSVRRRHEEPGELEATCPLW